MCGILIPGENISQNVFSEHCRGRATEVPPQPLIPNSHKIAFPMF